VTVRVAPSCTACGACLITCPTGALSRAPRRPAVLDTACTDCLECLEVCPAGAISLAGAISPAGAVISGGTLLFTGAGR
jgi:ferredoxin